MSGFKIFNILILSFLISLFSLHVAAQDSEARKEISELRRRKADFVKVKNYLAQSDRVSPAEEKSLARFLKVQDAEKIAYEKSRAAYVRQKPHADKMDAVQREDLEDKLLARSERAQELREKKYALQQEQVTRVVNAQHLEISESEEYDIQVPKKVAKVKGTKKTK